ncbi:hypothetical protein BC629DRAFT_1555353 [Irpex lacteus]|nr:hypothetical protein BC629DRAFT_1555353 [Irpex lacteus]
MPHTSNHLNLPADTKYRQKAGARTVTGPSRLDSCLFPELRQLTDLLPLARHPREPPSRPATEQELQMSTDSLKMPAEVLLPAGVPSRCRETARRDAEVVEEDRFLAAERPLTVLQSCSESDIRSTAGDLEAAEESQRVMSGKKAGQGKPAAAEFTRCYGFFAKELWRERRAYLTIVVRPLVLITLLIWTCLPVFWGALSNSPKYTPNLEAWFINRDGGRIGNTLWDSFNNKSAPATLRLGWVRVDPAAAGTDGQIMDAIVQQQAWVAVVIEANATTRLSRARANGDASYDPTSAITMYYAQARHEVAVGNYVLPLTQALLSSSCTAYATGSAQRYFAQITPGDSVNATAVNLLSVAPQTISPAVAWKTVNLRPYTAPAAQAVTLVGNIFLTMAHSAARTIIAPRLKLYDYLILRLVVPIMAYLPLSLSYTLVSLAFGLPFGGSTFSPAGGFFMTFLYLLHNFYSYGAGSLSCTSQAVRTIFFNTQNNLVQNAGVMIGWISLSCGTTLIFTWWMRRREIRALQVDESTSVPERLSRELQQHHHQQEQQQEGEAEADREKAVEVTVQRQPSLTQGSMTEIK